MTPPFSLLPPPEAFGLPARFSRWRDLQAVSILAAVDSTQRFIFQAAPTGFGKSISVVGQAVMSGARTCILTSTKGLQDQYTADFGDIGMVDIRGQNAYECLAAEEFGLDKGISVDHGPCHAGLDCALKEGGCTYYDQRRRARAAQLVVTNYAYWLTNNRRGEGLGKFDLLVCDESHDAAECVSDFLAVELEGWEVEGILGSRFLAGGATLPDWLEWASYHLKRVKERADRLTAEVKYSRETGAGVRKGVMREVRDLRRVKQKLEDLNDARGDWVVERRDAGKGNHKVTFSPVWPAPYCEEFLFRSVPKIVLVSATVRRKTAELLGIREGQYDFNEYPSTFPAARRPVYWVPTCRLNHRTDPSQLGVWLNRIDQIIGGRLDRKGIVHTVSYARRAEVLSRSCHAQSDILLSHSSENTRAAVERFKGAAPPCVLVSPSIVTGYDFPGAECEYQVIAKVPFPDTRSELMQARVAADKDYANYLVAQQLVQATGRGMRSAEDRCETLIIDDQISWFVGRFAAFFPQWWLDSFRRVATIPAPLLKL